MPRRGKGQVAKGRGMMCNICGKNCGRGGSLKKHVETQHSVSYRKYTRLFYGGGKVLIDAWDGSGRTSSGKKVLIHTMVWRLIGDPGHRGATPTATPRHK